MEKVIINTDIFGDFDDLLALLSIKNSLGTDLEGVVTTKEDIRDKAICTRKLLDLAGRTDVPVFYSGQRRKKKGKYMSVQNYSIYTSKDSKKSDSELKISPEGVDFIIDKINSNPKDINILSLSTCSNIAEAMKKSPEIIQKIKAIYMMGGVLERSLENLNKPEHNYMRDRESFNYVTSQKVPIYLTPREITLDLFLDPKILENLKHSSEFHKIINQLGQDFLSYTQRDSFRLSDPIAVGPLLFPQLFRKKTVELKTEKGNQGNVAYCVPTKESTIQAVYDFNREEFYKNLIQRL